MKPQTAPIKTKYGSEVLFIEYRDGHPFTVIVRDDDMPDSFKDGYLDEYEFEWSKKLQRLYYRDASTVDTERAGLLSDQTHEKKLVQFWAAGEVQLVDESLNPIADPSKLGWKRLRAPKGDPFADAYEGRCCYCRVCKSYIPDENPCQHIFTDGNGESAGSGADGYGGENHGRDEILSAVRRLGCARALRKALATKGAVWSGGGTYVHIGRRHYHADIDRDSLGYDGVRWIETLTPRAPKVNKKIVAWLDVLIAEQNARRASGEKCYDVVARSGDERYARKVSWREALRVAREKRADREHSWKRVTIVRRVKKAPR